MKNDLVTIEISFEQLLDALDQLSQAQKQLVIEYLQSSQTQSADGVRPEKRRAGLEEGTIWMSDDFIDPLL